MLSFKRYNSLIIVVAIFAALSGCQSAHITKVDSQTLFYDQGFQNFDKIKLEKEQDIFFLGDEAKQFVKNTISNKTDPLEQMTALVETIFGHSKFNLLYDGNANTVANETFKNRAANCLSMSIMTYALAEEAGFGVSFQQVDIPEYWTRQGGYSLLNGHINLRMLPKATPNVYQFFVKGYQVDFDPQASRQHFPKRLVTKKTVLAMFYNNKGAEALVNHRFAEAYAYFRQAIKVDQSFGASMVNLGLLYRLNGYYPQAQLAYDYAIILNSGSLTAMENLAYLYLVTDREEAAAELLKKVERKRADNPFYYVNLGETELDMENYELALSYFKKALSLSRNKPEIYFGLARVYFKLGELTLTRHYLHLAKNYAKNIRDEERYQGKLNFLTSL
ncbi:tetratricopeptide repeat protein [Paraglaciecola sp.]|uniref:tetratricopeptide repeat protein n=1 Tax=Paraglaciecola sp. TaxID=1920173 RepID=UPI0030F49DCC